MKGIVVAGLDAEALQREYPAVMAVLTSKCGLSDYQARCYLSLVAQGEASAEQVADVGQLPRTSAYKSLRALCGMGWAKSIGGRPELYAPTQPADMAKKLTGPIDDAMSKVARVEGLLSARGTPQMVYTIIGRARVVKRMSEIVEKATKTLIIATPRFSVVRPALQKPLRNAVRRGVRITVVTEPYQRVPDGVEVKRRSDLLVTDLIADGTSALLASPDLEACGYTDNPQLTRHLEDFLKIIVEKS
jgi:sugar-specific transcriptional regulator TrmB